MHGDDVGHRLAQIVVDAAPETDGPHNRPEIIVQQHKRRCFARHIGATSTHGDADIGRLERRRVIHTVPGHRNHGAMRLECLDDAQLLRRHDAGEDADAGDGRRKLGLAHALNRRAVQHILALKPGPARDRAGRDGIIAGDHDHADARRLALADSCGNGGAQRIGERRQAEQRERKAPGCFQPWSFSRRFGNRQDAHAGSGQAVGFGCQGLPGCVIEAAQSGDRLRGALCRDPVVWFSACCLC